MPSLHPQPQTSILLIKPLHIICTEARL